MKIKTTQLLANVMIWTSALATTFQSQSLFKDLIPGPHPASSTPDYFMNDGSTMYFVTTVITGSLNNNQLWKSDGTVAGTVLVKDDLTTTNIFNPVKLRASVNGTLYFTVFDNPGCSACAPELWKSDGTTAGTVLVKTLDYTSFLGGGSGQEPTNFAAVGNKLVFQFSKDNGYELWVSDGTSAGTTELLNLNPSGDGVDASKPMIAFNGKVYFNGSSILANNELYETDGTAGGTILVKEINPSTSIGGGSDPGSWFLYNNELYFTADDGTDGGIWKTDGTTAGTVNVKSPSGFSAPIIFKNEIYFGNGGPNYELWKTDGTTAGTVMIKDMVGNPRGANNDFVFTHYTISLPTPPYYENVLWKSDGTTAGTTEVSYDMGMTSSRSVLGNNMYITRTDSGSVSDVGVWVTDGTTTSKLLVGYGTGNVHVFNNKIFFSNYESATGYELWSLDGGPISGITSIEETEKISVYPNPSNGIITISLKANKVEVYTIAGEKILEEYNTAKIDISKVPKGIYFAKITAENETQTSKIVLE